MIYKGQLNRRFTKGTAFLSLYEFKVDHKAKNNHKIKKFLEEIFALLKSVSIYQNINIHSKMETVKWNVSKLNFFFFTLYDTFKEIKGMLYVME